MTNKAFGKHNIPYSQARLCILYTLYTHASRSKCGGACSKAFGKHNIPYSQVEGGVVPTLAHKLALTLTLTLTLYQHCVNENYKEHGP